MELIGVPAQRLGTWLLAFGIVGLVLTVAMAVVWLGGLVAIADLDERLEAERQATAAALTDAADLLDSTAVALESTSGSLDTVGATLDDSARLLDSLASTTHDLADSLGVSILGQQPFGGLAASFEDVATELDTFATHAADLAAEVDQMQPDLAAVAANIRTVQESVASLATRVETYDGVDRLVGLIRVYALLSALLAAWLAILAGGCVWVGRALRRVPPSVSDASAAGASTPTS